MIVRDCLIVRERGRWVVYQPSGGPVPGRRTAAATASWVRRTLDKHGRLT